MTDTAPPKVMGFADILIFCLGTGISIRWLAVAAAAGSAALSLWGVALVLFYIPLVLVVAEMTARYDAEGGVYMWTRETMGDFAAFVCGWCYWTANLAYLPSLLIFVVGVAAYLGGIAPEAISPFAMFGICAVMMIGIAVLNIIGLDKSKWLTNIGGGAVWVALFFILAAGAMAIFRGETATPLRIDQAFPPLTQATVALWAIITFAFSGTEGISFVRTEIRGGQRALVRALLVAGVCIAFAYVAGTIAVMAVLPSDQIGAISGVPQALDMAMRGAGWAVLAPVAIALVAISTLGGVNAWFGASARLPFAAGIDNFLPAAFGRRHPRYKSPYIALITQAVMVIVFLAISQIGSSGGGTYAFLIRMSILGYSIPYLYIFWSYIQVQSIAPATGVWLAPGGHRGRVAMGWIALITTVAAIAATLIPDPAEGDPLGAFLKLAVAGTVLLASGVALYAVANWRRRNLVSVTAIPSA